MASSSKKVTFEPRPVGGKDANTYDLFTHTMPGLDDGPVRVQEWLGAWFTGVAMHRATKEDYGGRVEGFHPVFADLEIHRLMQIHDEDTEGKGKGKDKERAEDSLVLSPVLQTQIKNVSLDGRDIRRLTQGAIESRLRSSGLSDFQAKAIAHDIERTKLIEMDRSVNGVVKHKKKSPPEENAEKGHHDSLPPGPRFGLPLGVDDYIPFAPTSPQYYPTRPAYQPSSPNFYTPYESARKEHQAHKGKAEEEFEAAVEDMAGTVESIKEAFKPAVRARKAAPKKTAPKKAVPKKCKR